MILRTMFQVSDGNDATNDSGNGDDGLSDCFCLEIVQRDTWLPRDSLLSL